MPNATTRLQRRKIRLAARARRKLPDAGGLAVIFGRVEVAPMRIKFSGARGLRP